MYKLKLGKSLGFFLSDSTPNTLAFERQIKELKDLGFDSVDIGVDRDMENREREIYRMQFYDDCFKIVQNNGLYLNCVHMSFGPTWEFSSLDKNIRDASLRQSKELFEIIDKYNPFGYVLHASRWVTEKRKERLELLKESLKQLRTYTKANICVETLPRDCLCHTTDEIIDVVDAVEGINICADVNHLLQERSEDAILKMGSRIKTLHISDYDYVDERHLMPGKGLIDWMELIGNLEKIGYTGVFNYELGYSAKEIKENYDWLFEKYNKLKNVESVWAANIAKYGNKE